MQIQGMNNNAVIDNQNVRWAPVGLDDNDRSMLRTVFAGAVSSEDKTKCGRGYMGLSGIDGKVMPVKFLTHATERALGFKSDKALMKDFFKNSHDGGEKGLSASDRLETILRCLADKVGAHDIVDELIDRYKNHAGKKSLLSRKVVFNAAKAINEHAKAWGQGIKMSDVQAESSAGKDTSVGRFSTYGSGSVHQVEDLNAEWVYGELDIRIQQTAGASRKQVTDYFDYRDRKVKLARDMLIAGSEYQEKDIPVKTLKNILVDMRVLRGQEKIGVRELTAILMKRWPNLKLANRKTIQDTILLLLNDKILKVKDANENEEEPNSVNVIKVGKKNQKAVNVIRVGNENQDGDNEIKDGPGIQGSLLPNENIVFKNWSEKLAKIEFETYENQETKETQKDGNIGAAKRELLDKISSIDMNLGGTLSMMFGRGKDVTAIKNAILEGIEEMNETYHSSNEGLTEEFLFLELAQKVADKARNVNNEY